jgi:hypothetical protein
MMSNLESKQTLITEDMAEKFFELNKKAKEIEKELAQLKKMFNNYFDLAVGQNEKGALFFNSFVLQRQIRVSEKYREEETVEKLEEMQLGDCIRIEKKIDEDKVSAAMTLGLISPEVLDEYKDRKYTKVITVREK